MMFKDEFKYTDVSSTPNLALRVGFDLRYLQQAYRNTESGGLGGVGVYIQGLWKAIARLFPQIQLVGLVDHGDIPGRLQELLSCAQKYEVMQFGLGGRGPLFRRLDRSSFSWIVRALESEFKLGIPRAVRGLDILHITNQSPAPAGICPTIITIYDLCPFGAGVSIKKTLLNTIHQKYLSYLGRADQLVCISTSTSNDVNHYLSSGVGKTTTVHPGIDLEVFKSRPDGGLDIVHKLGISTNYFIHVGVCSGRKNPSSLIRAMKIAVELSDDDFSMVFVGPYQVNENAKQLVLGLARNHGISEKVMILGDVSNVNLAALYQNAMALVFPSFYEGFGYPAVESLACGTPCIVSNVSSLPEAVGDLGILVDPEDPVQIADAMLSVINSKDCENIRTNGPIWAKKFSWDQVAINYVHIYHQVVLNNENLSLRTLR